MFPSGGLNRREAQMSQAKAQEAVAAQPLKPEEVGSLIRRTPSFRNTKDKKALAAERHSQEEEEDLRSRQQSGSPSRSMPPPESLEDHKATRTESLKKEKPKRTLSLKSRKHTPR